MDDNNIVKSNSMFKIIPPEQAQDLFVIQENENEIDSWECGTPLQIFRNTETYNANKFDMYMLYNKNYKENSIYQVYVKKEKIRIGWIFPLQALLSDEHDKAQDEFFLRIAYVAFLKLLGNISIDKLKSIEGNLKLDEIYSGDLQILLLDSDNYAQIPDFSYKDYMVSLSMYGYVNNPNGFSLVDDALPIGEKLMLNRQSIQFDNTYIVDLFQKILPSQPDTDAAQIGVFYYLYQVIELMISKIFDKEFSRFLRKIKMDSSNLFNEKEQFEELVPERGRVVRLMTMYTNVSAENKIDIGNCSHEIISYFNIKEGKDWAANFYSIRCFLVHNLYKIDDDGLKKLHSFNKISVLIISELLFTFDLDRS